MLRLKHLIAERIQGGDRGYFNFLSLNQNVRLALTRLFSVLAWIVLSIGFVIFLVNALRYIFYPLPLDYGEGVVLNLANLIHKYGNYFFDIHNYPCVHGAYPPIFPWLASLFVGPYPSQFMGGRIISFLAAVLIGLILYLIFFNKSSLSNRKYPLIFALTFFIPSFVDYSSPLMRVDTLAIFFSVLGLYLFARYDKAGSPWRWLAVILFILAFYTKQNAVSAPLAVGAFLLLRNRRDFAKFITLYLTPLLVIFYFINWQTGGQFYTHLVTLTKFIPLNIFNLPLYYLPFVFYSIGFLIIIFRYYKSVLAHQLYWLYFVFNMIFLVTVAKPGAGFNYYIEPFISLLIVFGLVFMQIIPTTPLSRACLLYGIFVFQLLLLFPYKLAVDLLNNPILPPGHRERAVVNQYVQASAGPVLSEDWGYLLINGREAFYEPFQFSMMSNYGLWDESNMVRQCEAGKFSLVIAGWRIFNSKGLAACLERYYSLVDKVGHYQIFRPRMTLQSL